MLINNKILYAGITNEEGLKLIEQNIVVNTGYQIQRITDGSLLGIKYELKDYEDERLFIEVDDGLNSSKFIKDNIIIAGVENEIGFDLCIKQEDLFTGKKFIRIHDGFEMGNVIYLGIDFSYDKKGRVDLPKYYVEVEDIRELEENLKDE